MTTMTRERLEDFNQIVNLVQALEDQAMRAGFPITSRALNQAKDAIGWEVTGNTELADLARVGRRVGEDR